jgi:hypothetical protein
LNVIAGAAFPHLLYHFVLTYSNWETGTICFSESFASLSESLPGAEKNTADDECAVYLNSTAYAHEQHAGEKRIEHPSEAYMKLFLIYGPSADNIASRTHHRKLNE